MSIGHDTKCPKCKGSGEIEVYRPSAELGKQMLPFRIVECALCCGTGLVELDESWEHA